MFEYTREETAQPVYYMRKTPASPGHNNNKKSRKGEEIDRVINEIIPGYKVVILLRGLPGSGKSTLAKSILERTIGYNPETVRKHILSTDDFFVRNGVYDYQPQKISEAHGWNHQRAFNVMSKGYSPVIIDNTNTQMWEMKPYASMATDFGYILEILEPDTHWCYNERELEKRNTHGVSKKTIQSMLDRYEKNVTPLKLFTAYGFQYKLQKPPQYRLQPPIEPIGTMNNVQYSSASNSNLNKNNAAFTEVTASFKPQQSFTVLNKPAPSTSVDDILMRTDESSMLKAPVLTPMNQTAKIKQSTSLFDNINAWGIDEKALRSWNLVTPIELEETEHKSSPILIDDSDEELVETQEMSTSTDNEDFYVLRNLPAISGPLPAYKVLLAYNRDINRETPMKTQHSITKKTMIDKSCLTLDYLDDHQMHLDNLTGVFPNITPRSIRYWYEKCHRDFDCTMELLLNENDEIINIVIEENEPPASPAAKPTTPKQSIPVESDGDSSDSNEPPPTPRLKNKRKNNTGSSSDEYQDLKKHIESKITISNDHYSEHLLKVKQCKYGPKEPSAPQPILVDTVEDQRDIDSDDKTDSDELEWEFVTTAAPSCSKNPVEPVEQVDTIEMNIGDHFVKQLEDRFGDPNLTYPKGFQPVIQIPETLARQLYTFYIESVYQQMDAQNAVMEDLVKEDEDFARTLQESEEETDEVANSSSHARIPDKTRSEPTEIPDIMREQKELSKRQKEADKWKEDTPDTLAARLTKDKLFKAFPSVDKDTLVEILHAHGNIYKDTVDTLLASTSKHHIQGDLEFIRNPPLNEAVVQELWDAHNSCRPIVEVCFL